METLQMHSSEGPDIESRVSENEPQAAHRMQSRALGSAPIGADGWRSERNRSAICHTVFFLRQKKN